MAYKTTLDHYGLTGSKRHSPWYAVKATALPHVINGYYTVSSLMHAITGRHFSDVAPQQNKFVALLTTITHCSVCATDGTFLDQCSQDPNRVSHTHAMDVDKFRKILCGRPPIETIWPGVHEIIAQGSFARMTSKVKNRDMGVLPLNLKNWLPNYNHTRHIMLPSPTLYTADELIVVPSENAQIQAYEASGRLSPISIAESPAKPRSTKNTKKAP
jgi:hypothetical protein